MEAEQPTLRLAWLWAARVVACSFLILGALFYWGFMKEGSTSDLMIAFLCIGGALAFAFGIELPLHPAARAARWVGWGMLLAVAVLLRGGPVYLSFPVAFLGLPAVIRAPRRRVGSPLRG